MKQNILIEIKAGEGGNDSRLLVDQQLSVYLKVASRSGL
jgi:protein subunit release factor A